MNAGRAENFVHKVLDTNTNTFVEVAKVTEAMKMSCSILTQDYSLGCCQKIDYPCSKTNPLNRIRHQMSSGGQGCIGLSHPDWCQVTRQLLRRQGYDGMAPGRPEPLRGGGTMKFEWSSDLWFRLARNSAQVAASCADALEKVVILVSDQCPWSDSSGRRLLNNQPWLRNCSAS